GRRRQSGTIFSFHRDDMARRVDNTAPARPRKTRKGRRSARSQTPRQADSLHTKREKYKPRRDHSMLNEQLRLMECMDLFELLLHYIELGKDDRDIWHDRLTEFNGLQGRD